MRRLQDRLDAIKAGFAKQAPPEALELMGRSTQELRDSGILDGLPAVGDRLAPFTLADSEGQSVGSRELLEQGPLVISVYRGVW